MDRGRKVAGVLLQKSRNTNWLLPAVFLFLTVAIAVSGYVYYQKQKNAVIHEQITQLKAIADLKAVQIRDWLRERTSDARLIGQNPIMVAELAAFLGDRSRESRKNSIQRWMEAMQSNYHYENVMFLDRQGEVVLSANPHHAAIGSEGFKAMETALRSRDAVLSDLHRNPKVPHIHLDMVAPVLVENGITGFIFLRINPVDFLFPMIQSWPTPSPSAETLLVKREGEEVVFLNELRHRQGAALTLRLPLHDVDLPAALAVLGKAGITAGRDYRGVAVRSVSRSIPDTPWFIVAKIDEEEITAPLLRSAGIIFFVTLALIIATALVVLTLWRYQATRFQQRQLEAENQRLALSQHYDYLTRYANDIILLSDKKWNILEANERAMLTYGRNRENLLSMNLRDLRVVDEQNKLTADYKQTEEKLGAIFETWHLKKDGSVFPVEVSARVIAIDGKKYYQSIIRDISERKQAEKALRETEAKFRQTFEFSPVGIVMVGLDKRFVSSNKAFSESLGYSPEELIGKTIADITYPDDIEIGMNEMQAIAKSELTLSKVQKRYLHKDGRIIWGEATISLIRDHIANPQYFMAIIEDITERKQVEDALRESEEKFKQVFETANVGKSITKLSGEINVNQAFGAMLGYSREDLQKTKWQELTPAEDIASTQKVLEPLLQGRQDAARFSKRYIHKNGQIIWGDVSVAIRRDAAGKPLHFITTVVDITEHKQAEKTLHEIIDNAPFGAHLYELQSGGRLVFTGANRAADSILGVDNRRFIGKTIEEAFPPLIQTAIPDAYRRAAASGERFDTEQVEFAEGGIRGAFEVHAFQTSPNRMATFFFDITERKQAEAKLQREQALYMDLVNALPAGMYRLRVKPAAKWDPDSWRSQVESQYVVDFVSDRFCGITGIDRQEFIANPGLVPDRIHPDDSFEFTQKNTAAILSLSTFSWEGRMIVPDKGATWIRFESIPRPMENGEVIWTGIINDISERKRAEETIRQSAARLRSVLDATPFPIAIVDVQDNKIDFWSRSALTLFGHTAPTTEAWYELAYPDPAYRREVVERWKPFLKEAQRSGQAVNTGEYRITCRDGSVLICELYAAFLAENLIVTFNNVTKSKQAEERLNENHMLMRIAGDMAKLGGWNVNLNENRSYWSDEVAAIHEMPPGYSPLVEDGIRFYAPEWRERITKVFTDCAQNGIPYNEEMEIITATGKRLWVHTIGEAVKDDRGRIFKVQGAFQDITAHKQAEQKLQLLSERNQAMLEAVPDIIMEVDTDKIYLWANHAGYEFFGADVIGHEAGHYFEGEQKTYQQVKPLFNGHDEIIYVESWQRRRDGEKRLLAWWCRVLKDESGKVTGALSSGRDITEVRLAEEALRESERKFRETVVNLDEGYYSVTLDGKLLEHNQAFNRILGFDISKDLKGTRMPDFWQNPEDRQVYVRELSATGAISNYPINAKTQQGEKITVLASAHLVKDENNQPRRIEGAFMDISQRVRAELEIQRLNEELERRVLQRTEQLQAANKELEAFSYSVSHDLRAPLRAIDGFSRIVLEDYSPKLDNEGRRLLNVITGNTQKMGRLIDDLLAFSRLSRQQMAAGTVNLAVMARVIGAELKKQEKGRRIEFKVGDLPVARGDHSMLQQVLQNLLANAVKFTRTRPRARIEFSAKAGPTENTYCIKDNGVGFDMQYVGKLFGVFQRLHSTDEFEGTGVGLAIVQRIIARHGGRVWAESEGGKGAMFYFSLPVEQGLGSRV